MCLNCPAEQSLRGNYEAGNIGEPIHEIFLQYDQSLKILAIHSFVRMKELRSITRRRVDFKEKITERYPGEVYPGDLQMC